MPNYIGRVNDAAPGLVFGVLLIVVVMVAPRGLVGLMTDALKRLASMTSKRGRPTGPTRSGTTAGSPTAGPSASAAPGLPAEHA